MPIYEYVCSDCDLKFELIRSLSQAEEGALCPRCQNSNLHLVAGNELHIETMEVS